MILSFVSPFGDGKAKTCEAEITCEHSASSYNIPVVVLKDGNVIDMLSWTLFNYKVKEATPEEMKKLKRAGYIG